MTSYEASLCAVDSQQEKKQQAIQQSQLQQLKQNMLMTVDGQRTVAALPISVTASSHPGPSTNGNQEQVELIMRQRIQQQMQNSSQKGQVQMDKNGQYHTQTSGVLTNINNTSQTVLVHPYSQMQSQPQARSRSTITLAARLAAPGSGITLPTSIKKSDNLIRKVERTQAKHTLRNSNGAAETNLLYSSACRASVTQQAALRTLTETNGNSTTGAEPESAKNVGNQVSSTLSQQGKYQKVPVVGGKSNPTICKPMVRTKTLLYSPLLLGCSTLCTEKQLF